MNKNNIACYRSRRHEEIVNHDPLLLKSLGHRPVVRDLRLHFLHTRGLHLIDARDADRRGHDPIHRTTGVPGRPCRQRQDACPRRPRPAAIQLRGACSSPSSSASMSSWITSPPSRRRTLARPSGSARTTSSTRRSTAPSARTSSTQSWPKIRPRTRPTR